MRTILLVAALLFTAACAEQPATSLGDSPLKEIRCPTFLDDTGCVKRAERACGTERVTVISTSEDVEELGRGTTVPIEGTIRYRLIVVRCEYE